MTDPGTETPRERALRLTAAHVAPHRVAVWDAFGTQLVIGRREGYRLWDLSGHELIDMHLNGGTFNLGHRAPEVVASLVEAVQTLDIGNHHFASVQRAELAARLAQLTPGDLTYTVFSAGGGEAVDVAIKTARAATGRRPILGLDHGFHGRTGLAGAAGQDAGARYFHSDQPDEFSGVPFGDLDAAETALRARGHAALIIESVPATYGFPVPPPGYLPALKELCETYGALYIADEVQTGLGRTGRLWGVETFGVKPDILVAGKGLSGGIYPIAATVISDRAGGWLREYGWGHVSTFGGSELGCRVAETVLDITTRASTCESVQRLTDQFSGRLAEIAYRNPYLDQIRQCGLVIGLKVDHPNGGVYLQQELFERGVWAIASGFESSVLQFKPGLLLAPDDADLVLDRLEAALDRAKDIDRPVPSRHGAPAAARR